MFSFTRPAGVKVEYLWIKTGKKRRMRILIARPEGDQRQERPGVLWLHGGGYATGMPEMVWMSRAVDLVIGGGAVVVSPAYTLSPFAPYPHALDDCHRALVYMKKHAAELGIRADQIMVGGESAGGGLTAALCMYAHDHRTVNIAFQMPLYPMIDCFDTDSSRENHGKVWNTRRNHQAWQLYLRSLKNWKRGGRVPSYASPSRRKDYTGLPPCYTFVGDIEPFHDETLAYVKALQEAGVPAKADVWPGFYHAYDMMKPQAEDAKRAAAVFLEEFRNACRMYTSPQD